MKCLLSVVIILSGTFTLYAQTESLNKNIIYGEFSAFGVYNEGTITLNYERIIIQKGLFNFYGRAGAGRWGGTWTASGKIENGWKFNLGGGTFLGRKSHHLDAQFGADIYEYNKYSGFDVDGHGAAFHPYGLLGYRYQKPGQAFMFRLAAATYGYACIMLGVSF